ncbi:hypothetical protein ACFSX5_08190 [Devosia albogilva]|uniref:Uncharacterized protein n=1 Tax=Devosia albogilva TaxID=429726 RepID=A0ABW5QJV0_9HYPH
MITRTKVLAGAMLGLVLSVGLSPAFAQDRIDKKNPPVAATTTSSPGVDFGDNTSEWANDDECDDPRFTGTGMAAETWDDNEGHDAADCQAAFEAGTITLIETGTDTTTATTAPAIDFGDDSSVWAKDEECDDPRFTGTGMAAELEDVDLGKDATDCRALYEAGSITFTGEAETASADVDFGDDTSAWAHDGECDDPRFSGTGMAAELEAADIGKDATDCRALLEDGSIAYVGETQPADDIDYGDDTSEWARDEECDDARFTGSAMAAELDAADIGKDATDCRAGVEAGTLSYAGEQTAIDFGDDSSEWANDDECDDPRFTGPGMAEELLDSDIGKDATDCRALFMEGLTFKGDVGAGAGTDTGAATPAIDYGNDSSEWANDEECDDPRFSGEAVAQNPLTENIGRDATDCRTAVEEGTATYIGELGAPAVATFDYGSDWSKWANDGECDDPRFAGPGTAKKLLDEDEYGDATDCRTLEEAGEVRIIPVYTPEYAAAAPYDSKGIAFGDNSSSYANDELCDDPRFVGPGTASVLYDADIEHDAADCEAAYKAGTVMLVEEI